MTATPSGVGVGSAKPAPGRGWTRRSNPTLWAWTRVLAGAAVLAVLVWRLGTGPFLDGVRTINGWSLAAGAAIAVVTTVCCAWRWRLVARGLGVEMPLPAAVAAYYRSQFLNTVLPGGVLGDVHRGVRHGRDVDDVGRGLRAVAWERSAGQVVQAVADAGRSALRFRPRCALPRRWSRPCSWRPRSPPCFSVASCLTAALPAGRAPCARSSSDIRHGLLDRRAWPGIVIASGIAVVGHAATFLIAARTAGSTVSVARMLPLALLVLLATGLPTNIGGWGPREGMAAWAFGAAGLGADQGVATAVVYGVLVLVANLPGAVVLLTTWLRAAADARTGRVRPRRGRRPLPDPGPRMADRPYTLLSCGMSIDGYLDSASEKRLALSNEADFDRVDAVRAASDAILVGAATVRNDNPRLLVRSPARRHRAGRPRAHALADEGDGDRTRAARSGRGFLHERRRREAGLLRRRNNRRCPGSARGGGDSGRRRATKSTMRWVSEDLLARGVQRLMVEGVARCTPSS